MEALENFIVEDLVGALWGTILPILLVSVGLYFGVRTIMVQLRMLPDMFRAVVEPVPRAKKGTDGALSPFKAFTISAASRVGTANIVGVALAIAVGGPGAVFWMWVIAILGGATSFIESTLGQLYKTREGGHYRGGPAYYMTRGLRAPWLATIFAVAISVTFGLVYNALQTNAVVEAVTVSLGAPGAWARVFIGLGMVALTALVIFGGVQRIANVTQFMVPIMAGAYLVVGIVVVVLNIGSVPAMFGEIVGEALGLREVAGGSVWLAITYGIQRGLFSNEAGEGSVPNAAATATVSHPVKQGLVQTLGVYFDTLLVCTITAFILLLGRADFDDSTTGSATQYALASVVGQWGIHFVTVVLFFLAFSSVIGNYYLAQANVQYLTDSTRAVTIFRCLVLVAVFFGAIASVPIVWGLGDLAAAVMVLINVCAIVPLGGIAVKLMKNYTQQRVRGVDPVFHRDMLPGVRGVECWDGTDAATKRWREGAKVLPQ